MSRFSLSLLLTILTFTLTFNSLIATPGEWHFDVLDPISYIVNHQDGPVEQKAEMVAFLQRYPPDMSVLSRKNAANGANDANDNFAPEQLRWTITTANTTASTQTYSITWITFDKTDKSQLQLKCGGEEVKTMDGTQWTYSAGVTSWIGWLHRVTNVVFPADAVTCEYRVGTESHWSQWQSVKPLKRSYPFRMAIYGDMGVTIPAGGFVTTHILNTHRRDPLDLIFHVGDIAYAGTGSKWEFEFLWDVWGRQMEPLTSEIPFIAGLGNHEKYYDFASYRNRFDKPQNGDKTFYFSFDVGRFHFVSASSEAYITPFATDSVQWQWLDADMREARQRGQEIIFTAHRPMYSSEKSAHTMVELQAHIEPLLRKHNVALYVNGHMHCYERTTPITNVHEYKKVDPNQRTFYTASDLKNATMHLTVGTGGAWIYNEFRDNDWSVLHRTHYGFGVLSMLNETILHFGMYETFHEPEKAVDEFYVVYNG